MKDSSKEIEGILERVGKKFVERHSSYDEYDILHSPYDDRLYLGIRKRNEREWIEVKLYEANRKNESAWWGAMFRTVFTNCLGEKHYKDFGFILVDHVPGKHTQDISILSALRKASELINRKRELYRQSGITGNADYEGVIDI